MYHSFIWCHTGSCACLWLRCVGLVADAGLFGSCTYNTKRPHVLPAHGLHVIPSVSMVNTASNHRLTCTEPHAHAALPRETAICWQRASRCTAPWHDAIVLITHAVSTNICTAHGLPTPIWPSPDSSPSCRNEHGQHTSANSVCRPHKRTDHNRLCLPPRLDQYCVQPASSSSSARRLDHILRWDAPLPCIPRQAHSGPSPKCR